MSGWHSATNRRQNGFASQVEPTNRNRLSTACFIYQILPLIESVSRNGCLKLCRQKAHRYGFDNSDRPVSPSPCLASVAALSVGCEEPLPIRWLPTRSPPLGLRASAISIPLRSTAKVGAKLE